MSIEVMMFSRKWKDEIFNPDNFNDWVSENPNEAYKILIEIAKELLEENETLSQFDER